MSEWRPIETAPKNEVVLIWHEHEGIMTARFEHKYREGWAWVARPSMNGGTGFANWKEESWLDPCDDEMTFWMPLPEPPEAEDE